MYEQPGLIGQHCLQYTVLQESRIPEHEVDNDGFLILPHCCHVPCLQGMEYLTLIQYHLPHGTLSICRYQSQVSKSTKVLYHSEAR